MNPYEVLGVSPNDDEETIKKAYRTLVKKYHPDRYANTPMAEQANEKLKEINLAYDIICGKAQPQQEQGHGGYGGGYGSYGGYSGYGSYGGYNTGSAGYEASFENVRRLIAMRQFAAAEAMLNSLPQNAEWNYLMGVICLNRGWYSRAKSYLELACQLDPGNAEYRAALVSFASRAQSYRSYTTRINPIACCIPALCCSNLFCRSCLCCY